MGATHPKQAESLLAAGLQDRILLPGTPEYLARIDSYWSNSSKLRPACILQPQSAYEVADAVKALVAADQKFAIRSGGCNFWPSNNIENGVTIDLGRMAWVKYNSGNETVSIGPGTRWGQVYQHLAKYQRAVAGGREATVGVGGLVLGGGNTLFTGRHGFACDNVVEYEVVLASGQIIVATAGGPYDDLFVALKGGGNNFGIVTAFTMRALPCESIWGGGVMLPVDIMPAAADAFVEFTRNLADDPDSNLICMVAHLQPKPGIVIAALYANMAGVEKPPIFDKWLAFPELFASYKRTTILELMNTTEQATGYHGIWFTLSFANNTCILLRATELHAQLVSELESHIPDHDFKTQCIFQPLPRVFAHRSAEAGGNVLGLERNCVDGVLWGAHVMVRTAALEAWAYPRLRAYAASVNGLLDWTTANYANPSQRVLQSYGPVNVERIREAARKYDPEGVFQRLCPGGFKILEVDAGVVEEPTS
ncbi:Bifunctional solanapyrone synthase [Madurella mycetomatis]|uniref:Bifunctional solanapyrone synthase n=1 Tax=Madurella mycetomatis TaxID=100816 RepID=A0A175VRZ1_9PEZI|nr:Bifunctional solanapyrone synthase [Madurella mycetomatis]